MLCVKTNMDASNTNPRVLCLNPMCNKPAKIDSEGNIDTMYCTCGSNICGFILQKSCPNEVISEYRSYAAMLFKWNDHRILHMIRAEALKQFKMFIEKMVANPVFLWNEPTPDVRTHWKRTVEQPDETRECKRLRQKINEPQEQKQK